jgi:hypothetical protein
MINLETLLHTDFGNCRLTTARIQSMDGTPLFNSVFHEGTPVRTPRLRNREYTSEADARAGHAELVCAVSGAVAPVSLFAKKNAENAHYR